MKNWGEFSVGIDLAYHKLLVGKSLLVSLALPFDLPRFFIAFEGILFLIIYVC